MKHTMLASALLALTVPAAAQWPGDNFDSYANGTLLQNVGGWKGWDNVAAAAGTVDNSQSRSAPNSIRIDAGVTDAIHPLIGAVCGKWTVIVWQRIPTGGLAGGPVYLILNNIYNDGGPYDFTTQLKCSGTTIVDDFPRTKAPVPLVFDQWVQIRLEIDLNANTITSFYNNTQISTGTYAFSGPVSIENIDLFSFGGACHYDDIMLVPGGAVNEFDVFPGAGQTGITSISRGNFGTGEGAAWQGYPPSHFRGIGDSGASCTVQQFWYVVQDQNTITQDPYTFAARRGTGTGPTPGAAGLLFSFPTSTPLGTGGVGAWGITLTPATPVTVPCNDHFFVGWQFPPAPGWSATDGPSTQLRIYTADAQLAGQPHHSWQFIGNPDTPGTISQTSARVWIVKLRTASPMLNVGSLGATITPDFGATGMYTKVAPAGSGLGLTFRVRDAENANGTAVIFFGTAYDPAFALCNLGIQGRLWLTTGLIGQLHTMALGATGEGIGGPAWMGVNQLHRFGGGTPVFVLFQAITHTGLAKVRASNAAGTRLF
jgi:hypothetical protein